MVDGFEGAPCNETNCMFTGLPPNQKQKKNQNYGINLSVNRKACATESQNEIQITGIEKQT